MFSIKDELLRLFGENPADWRRADEADASRKLYASEEGGRYYHLEFSIAPQKLPAVEKMNDFLRHVETWDTASLNLRNEAMSPFEERDFSYRQGDDAEGYEIFADRFDAGSSCRVSLEITKGIGPVRPTIESDAGGLHKLAEDLGSHGMGRTADSSGSYSVCSVYEWEAYACFLLRESSEREAGTLPAYLNALLMEHPEGVHFLLHDAEADFATGAIAVAHSTDLPAFTEKRADILKRYNEASLYMGRTQNVLLPGDFHVLPGRDSLPEGGQAVIELINRYETVYSLLYLAAASWFENGELVMQLRKGGMEFHLPIEEITYNPQTCELAAWAFAQENAVERAEIARDVMAFYCRDAGDIVKIDNGILKAVRSNYKLYRKKGIDQYIALKKSLSDSILASTKQMQELITSLAGGLEKNFVAVVTVIITQVLAQHISWDTFAEGKFRTADFKSVVMIFSAASALYLAGTLFTIYQRWDFYKQRFELLREQYSGLLDKEELDEAFDNDRLIRDAESRLFKYALVVSGLWVLMIVVVLVIGCA